MKDVCCPQFNPKPWDNKILKWSNKKFIKEEIRTIFYMPIGFGKAMQKLQNEVEKAKVQTKEQLCLTECIKGKMKLYLEVSKEIKNGNNITLDGNFFSKVYEGSFQNTGKWMEDFNKDMIIRGYQVKKLYSWYTTCPKCAKKYGKNYVVLIAEI